MSPGTGPLERVVVTGASLVVLIFPIGCGERHATSDRCSFRRDCRLALTTPFGGRFETDQDTPPNSHGTWRLTCALHLEKHCLRKVVRSAKRRDRVASGWNRRATDRWSGSRFIGSRLGVTRGLELGRRLTGRCFHGGHGCFDVQRRAPRRAAPLRARRRNSRPLTRQTCT